jgi:hypothetical protein
MEIPRDGDYEEFRTFPDRGPAEALCAQLEFGGVPSYIESRALSSGVETTFVVFVLKNLAHRAFMRHVKLRSENDVDATALMKLVETAYADMKGRLKAERVLQTREITQ